MIGKISSLLLSGCAASAAAALGLSFASQASAQPYYDQPTYDQPAPYASDYATDTAANVGEIVVTPGYRPDRDSNGIPTERVYASRVVPIDDLDLSSDWGVRELHSRVAHAATDACQQLDNQWPQGLNPINSNDGDCKARAIRHAMAEAPITDPNYGYVNDNRY
jgi:UrcA family protein